MFPASGRALAAVLITIAFKFVAVNTFPTSSSALATALITIAYMTTYQHSSHEKLAERKTIDQHYDFIVIGGGTAGSVIASRLSESPLAKILLLEEGGPETVASEIPAMDIVTITSFELFRVYLTEPQTQACLAYNNRQALLGVAKILGGASSVNSMIYNRGGNLDFDGWERDHNCAGWSYKDVLPYFKKSENNTDPNLSQIYHGTQGPLQVTSTDPSQSSPAYQLATNTLINAAHQLGYRNVDLNSMGADQIGIAIPQRSIKNGRRHSTAAAYLEPVVHRENLHILTGAKVTKILIAHSLDIGLFAYGVEFTHENQKKTVYATREVIVSAGAIESPKLLMLSGIGPRSDLEKLGIPVLADLPVGENFHDHVRVGGFDYTVNQNIVTSPKELLTVENLEKYNSKGSGPLTSNFNVHQGAFLNYKTSVGPPPSVKGALFGPADVLINSANSGTPFGILSLNDSRINEDIKNKYFFQHLEQNISSLVLTLNHCKSRGTIKLRSCDPSDPPLIDPNYLSDKDNEDINRLIEAYQIAKGLDDTDAFKALETKAFEELLPGCEQYAPKTNRIYIECLIRHLSASDYHFSGSCKMGGRGDVGTVVDPKLKVQGVHQLRVADASIMPFVVAANTMATVIMIGEKAADMIKQDNRHLYPY